MPQNSSLILEINRNSNWRGSVRELFLGLTSLAFSAA